MALAIGIRKVGRKEAKTPRRCRKRTSEEERRRVSARQQKKILLLLLFTFFRPRLRRQSAPGLKKQNPVFSPSPSRVSFSLFDPSSDARESSRALSEIFHWFSGAKSSAFSSSTKRWRSRQNLKRKSFTLFLSDERLSRLSSETACVLSSSSSRSLFLKTAAAAAPLSKRKHGVAAQDGSLGLLFLFFFHFSLSLSRERIGRVFSFFRLLLATFLLRPSLTLPPPLSAPPPSLLLLFFPPQQRSENSLQRSAIGF